MREGEKGVVSVREREMDKWRCTESEKKEESYKGKICTKYTYKRSEKDSGRKKE